MESGVVPNVPLEEDVQMDVSDIRQAGWSMGYNGSDFGSAVCDPEVYFLEAIYFSRAMGDSIITNVLPCLKKSADCVTPPPKSIFPL